MATKQISEALFKQIVKGLEKLGISLSEVLGTRTGVKKIGTSLTTGSISRVGIETEVQRSGVEKILRLFREDARYLHEMNELEGAQFLTNINKANKIIHPDPLPEAGIFSLKEGKKFTADEFAAKKAADQGKIDSATLKAAMETSKIDQDLAKKLNLDLSKSSDFDKLQAWKTQHNVPDFGGEQGLESLFKTRKQNEILDLGSQLDAIETEGKSLAESAKKLADMAWKMSSEGVAAEEAARKALLGRSMEGKGFAGGVFGARSDGFYRAIVRPFLIDQHNKGKIKLADNTLASLKNSDDLKGGGDFMSADPVRVFRQHYGDEAFDLIPNLEGFGGGKYGPTDQTKVEILEGVIGKPILKQGPENPGGYLTKGEYQAKLDQEDEVLSYITNREGRFENMSQEEIAAEIAQVKATKDSILFAFRSDYPTANFQKKDFRTRKEWEQAEIEAQAAEQTLKLSTRVEKDAYLQSKEFKEGKDVEGWLTGGKGLPDEGFTTGKATLTPTKLSLNIRLMKNFDQPLDDAGLAQEGYNVQEIGILKNARNRLTTGEEMHPNEALMREKELLADEAGIDIDELKLDVDWGDMTPEPFASGGGVGSLFRETNRIGYKVGESVTKYAGIKIKDILDDLMKHKKIRDLVTKVNKKLEETGVAKMWVTENKLDKKGEIIANKILVPFVDTVEKMTPYKVSDKSSKNNMLAWFRDEVINKDLREAVYPDWSKGKDVYRGMKSKKNLQYSADHPSNMFMMQEGKNLEKFKPEHVGGFASVRPGSAIRYATEQEGFPRVTKTHLEPIEFQEAVERNLIENPYGNPSDVILSPEQQKGLKTDLLRSGIAAVKKYFTRDRGYRKGGLVSPQTLYENGIASMFRRV